MTAASAEVVRAEVDARILVVDDEPEIALLIADALRRADPSWQVVTETDPALALQRLQEEDYDCLVTDLVMPGMGGLALAQQARSADQGLALIAISGRGTIETSIEALRIGFADYLTKPFDLQDVQRAVCRTVRRLRQQRQHEARFAELAASNSRLEATQAQLNQKLEIASHDLVLSSRRLARQMEDLASVADVARSLMGLLELEELMGLCAELIGDRVPCETASVALYEAQDTAVGLLVRSRPDADDPPALCWLRSPLRAGVLCRAAQSLKTVHVDSIARSVLADAQEKELWRGGRLLAVPIPFHAQAVGVAVLHRAADAADFTAQDTKRATDLVRLMGPALRAAKTHHRQRCQVYATLEGLADAVEARDPWLRGHAGCVLAYAQPVALALELSQPQVGALQIAARLHDIGRLVIPDAVINHPGPLTDEQWEIVRRHPAAGADFLKPLDFFGEVGLIIRAHHESYDGTGYPDLKAGEEIPLVARVLAVADALDAMTSRRPYRDALSLDAALEQAAGLAGQQFDPRAVDALVHLPREALRLVRGDDRQAS